MKEFIFEHCETGEILKIKAENLTEALKGLLRELQKRFVWSDILVDQFEKWDIIGVHGDN